MWKNYFKILDGLPLSYLPDFFYRFYWLQLSIYFCKKMLEGRPCVQEYFFKPKII